MADKLFLWFEFIVVVLPTTLVVLISSILFPFGAMLRPEWIIPAYVGGLFGVYSLWRMFLTFKLNRPGNKSIITLCYIIGVGGLAFLLLGGKPDTGQIIQMLYSPWVLPIIVGGHWVYLLWTKKPLNKSSKSGTSSNGTF